MVALLLWEQSILKRHRRRNSQVPKSSLVLIYLFMHTFSCFECLSTPGMQCSSESTRHVRFVPSNLVATLRLRHKSTSSSGDETLSTAQSVADVLIVPVVERAQVKDCSELSYHFRLRCMSRYNLSVTRPLPRRALVDKRHAQRIAEYHNVCVYHRLHFTLYVMALFSEASPRHLPYCSSWSILTSDDGFSGSAYSS